MLKNYFIIAFRSIRKNKAIGFINLFGLSVGMTAAVFIFLWVQNEMSFDNYHPDKNNIYRITSSTEINKNEISTWESAPMLMAGAAIKEIPEVEKTARLITSSFVVPIINVNNKLFSEKNTAWVDKSWFNLFHYDFVAGDPVNFVKDPFSIILTESKAKKYFGSAYAIGQVIRVDTTNYTVQAVVKDNPANSSFQFDILAQMDGRLSDPKTYKNDKTWNNFGYISFLKLRSDANRALVSSKLTDILNSNRTNHSVSMHITPLSEMYFETDLQNSELPHGNKKTTYIFSILALFVLITACINYVNLTTARASLRAKEVSVRKIIGAGKRNLFFQFIAESLTISLLSLFATIILMQICLPVFNTITEKQFVLPLTSIIMWRVLIGTLFFAILLNGIYPAALLSSFKPLSVFRGQSILKLRDGAIRKGLVVFQFSLSVVLITGTIVIFRQLQYIQQTNTGYNVSQVMSLQIPFKIYSSLKNEERALFFNSIKNELSMQRGVESVCNAAGEITNVEGYSSGKADWEGRDTAFNPNIAQLSVDEGFQKMFQLQLITGRWFKPDKEDEHNYILNETALKELSIHQPAIGQWFAWGEDTGRVIAIVKDFHYKNLHEKIGPMVLIDNRNYNSYFFVKTRAGNVSQVLNAAEKVWAKFIPSEPFNYSFLDDSFNSLYKTDIKTSELMLIFSIIVIIISALGLFGLAAFTAEQRTKEIGIRKVLGASVKQITTLLSKDFLWLVTIAIVVASPLAGWVMSKWLQGFAYRINLSVWIFISAGVLALATALLSVSFQAIKAAIANPVKSLRTE